MVSDDEFFDLIEEGMIDAGEVESALYEFEVEKLCPVVDEVDKVTVTVVGQPGRALLPELHHLAARYGTFAGVRFSHEDLATATAQDFVTRFGGRWSATVKFSTAGVVGEVTASAVDPCDHDGDCAEPACPGFADR